MPPQPSDTPPAPVAEQQPVAPLLCADNLSKVFTFRQGFSAKKFSAVDEANFIIDSAKPEIFTIAGESGSGKTTLARMILGMEMRPGNAQAFRALVPLAEMSGYATSLRSATQGRGVFSMEFDHYAPLSESQAQKVLNPSL